MDVNPSITNFIHFDRKVIPDIITFRGIRKVEKSCRTPLRYLSEKPLAVRGARVVKNMGEFAYGATDRLFLSLQILNDTENMRYHHVYLAGQHFLYPSFRFSWLVSSGEESQKFFPPRTPRPARGF